MDKKLERYGLTEADMLMENGHRFVDVSRLGLRHEGKCCLDCGFMRRSDGSNKPCKGPARVVLKSYEANQ